LISTKYIDDVKHTTKRPYLIKLWMSHFGYKGLTTPWDVIYYDSIDSFNNRKLIKHEQQHIHQMRKEGKLLFLFNYCINWYKYGYYNNPYEKMAREASEKDT